MPPVSKQRRSGRAQRNPGFALAQAALGFSDSGEPEGRGQGALRRIAALARKLGASLPETAGAGDRLFTLNTGLFHDLAFVRLRDPHDPDGLLLERVLERRAGHPIALALLYLIVGRELGLRMRAVAMPGNLVVRVDTDQGPAFVDPAAGGILLSREDLELLLVHAYGFERASGTMLETLLEGMDDRQVLVRLLSELKRAYLHHDQPEKALWAADCILSLRPGSALYHRDRARLLEQLDCREAARADYRRYLELAPNAVDAEQVLRRMTRLQDKGSTLH